MTWEWGGPLYDPDLQKGKKKPRLSDVKVKFPPKPARCNEMNERIKELAVQAGDDWDHTMPEDKEFLARFAESIVAETCALLAENREFRAAVIVGKHFMVES